MVCRLCGSRWFLFSPVGILDCCSFFGLHTSWYVCLPLARTFQSVLIAFDNNSIYTLKRLTFYPFILLWKYPDVLDHLSYFLHQNLNDFIKTQHIKYKNTSTCAVSLIWGSVTFSYVSWACHMVGNPEIF